MTELKKLMADALGAAGFLVEAGKPFHRVTFLEQEKICISIQSLTAEQGAGYRYLGLDEDGEERYGMVLGLVIELSLLTPKASGGAGCEDFRNKVFGALLSGIPGLPLGEIQCGEIQFDGARDCYRSDIRALSRVLALGRKNDQEEVSLEGFRMQGTYQ